MNCKKALPSEPLRAFMKSEVAAASSSACLAASSAMAALADGTCNAASALDKSFHTDNGQTRHAFNHALHIPSYNLDSIIQEQMGVSEIGGTCSGSFLYKGILLFGSFQDRPPLFGSPPDETTAISGAAPSPRAAPACPHLSSETHACSISDQNCSWRFLFTLTPTLLLPSWGRRVFGGSRRRRLTHLMPDRADRDSHNRGQHIRKLQRSEGHAHF